MRTTTEERARDLRLSGGIHRAGLAPLDHFAHLLAARDRIVAVPHYDLGGDRAATGVATNYGALSPYITFINLFQFLLSPFGDRRG